MEFLMTYGWALLVLLVVVAVLFYIGVINPKNAQTNTLFFTPGFSAYSFRVGNGTGSLELDFGQAIGQSVIVTAISCSQNSTVVMDDLSSQPLSSQITIPSGEHRWVTGGNSNNGAFCTGEDGGQLSLESAQLGERYKGVVCVRYIEADTYVNRTVCGDINAQFEFASVPRPTATPGGSLTPTPTPTPTPEASPTPTPTPGCSGSCQDGVCNGCNVYLSSGSWVLEGDIICESWCNGITIQGSGATIDCQDHSVTGAGPGSSVGIHVDGADGATVKNCVVSNFNQGIYVYDSNNCQLLDNTANLNGFTGINMYSSSNNNLTGNTADSNSEGIYLQSNGIIGSSNNRLTENTATNNSETGIYADFLCTDNVFSSNTACSNTNDDIACGVAQIDGSGNKCVPLGPDTSCYSSISCNSGCPTGPPACAPGWVVGSCPCALITPGDYRLESNLSTNGAPETCITIPMKGSGATLDCQGHSIVGGGNADGIYLYEASGVTVRNCDVTDFGDGIRLEYASNSSITGNTVDSNDDTGISLSSAANNSVTNNNAALNRDYGIHIDGDGNNLTDNNASLNGQGILVYGSNNRLTDNTICSNTNNDLYCGAHQVDGDGNECTPLGTNAGCNIACNAGCPPPEPPACAEGWVVSECPCTLNAPGDYRLESDINATGYADCIKIPAKGSGSTLDCNGHNVSTNSPGGGTGITLDRVSGVRVENCNVSNFWAGIYLNGATGSAVINSNLTSNSLGVYVSDSNGNNITGNYASLSGQRGLFLGSSSNNNITGNVLISNSDGVGLSSASDNNFTTNVATGNTNDFRCFSGDWNYDGGNTCGTNSGCGGWLACLTPTPAP